MSHSHGPVAKTSTAAWVAGVLGTFLIMAGLVWALIRYTQPEDIAAARARERVQFLQQVRQAEAQATTTYAVVDAAKGFYQVPVEKAMDLVVREWQNPAAARSNLVARVEKLTELPPPPPAAPNPYE